MIQIVTGDLLNCAEDIIAHQVNCKGVAGGLAGVIFKTHPGAFLEYKQLLEETPEDRELLGHTFLTDRQEEDGKIIANMFGQYNPGADYRPDALFSALRECARLASERGYSVAIPYKLSCGICGGDWNEVLGLIKRAMKGVDCTIYCREQDAESKSPVSRFRSNVKTAFNPNASLWKRATSGFNALFGEAPSKKVRGGWVG